MAEAADETSKTPIIAEEQDDEEDEESSPNPSIFPLFPLSDSSSHIKTASNDPQWLSNSSFTFDISSIQTPIPSSLHIDEPDEAPPSKPPTFDFIDSSPSDRERAEKKRKKRKKKRKRSREAEGRYEVSRRSGVHLWAGSEMKSDKGYYVDTRGDYDNLVYGCLYRMDVARHKLYHLRDSSGVYSRVLHQWKRRTSMLDVENDVDGLDLKLREGGRYFSTKYSTLERHKDFKHVRVVATVKSLAVPGEFIPLIESASSREQCNNESVTKIEIEESWDDEVLRKTKEFNKMSREFPHDEKVWVAFAEFQDKIAGRQQQKAARLQMLEKKISILEKAVEVNPDNEDLLLCLLKACQSRDNTEVMMERWEKILRQHSGSCKLWKEFLLICQGEFSRFRVSDVRKFYACAIRSLSAACSKLCRQVHQTDKLQLKDPALLQLELGLVDVFISLCRFEWQTGYQEMATALFQAEIEYSLFCPSLLLSEQSKQRLFEHFWNGNGPRLGEDGALGWSSWLEKEEENRQKAISEDSSQETEVGGWTGWSELPFMNTEISKEPETMLEGDVGDEEIGEGLESEELKQEEDDIESMMKKLGIDVDAEADCEVRDTSTWKRWSEEESLRDCNQWMPMRESSGGKDDEQLSRVILYADVSEYIFSLWSEEARFILVVQFIDFFGGNVSRGLCTNSTSWVENTLGLETLPNSLSEDLRKVHEAVMRTQSTSSHFNLEFLLGSSNDKCRTSIMKFLRNALLLCLNVFPRNYILEEAVLVAEELYSTHGKTCAVSATPSRALAKILLKNDRQDLLLCGVYARREATFGNIDIARKVFDMALSSTEGLPLDLQTNIPLLYFWYAEMELAACTSGSNSEPAVLRATHILSCLGSGVKYSSFKGQPPSTQLLRAHQGFKEQIKNLRSAWACGDIRDQSIALICSAALFEELTTGWGAGLTVFEEAFTMALPEMLQRHLNHMKLSKAWKCILQGLQIYPYSSKVFAAFIQVGCLYTVPNKLRQIVDEYCSKKPSVIVWMFALSFELAKSGSEHRIHSLFERALVNDRLQKSVTLWRCYLAYEVHRACNLSAAKRIFFRAIHSCPWSKKLWLDGFQKLNTILTAKELSDLQEVMSDKELHLRTDIYEILLQDEVNA
ncbi:hypothetical protein MRB53_008637 [Persea americana]|uniref:Uncharacterized protein n=1 Tax=Persea americana TaxID=3435 RepID=A0ACC2MNG5_PERAE|nr:hypothetical protein MRB53_008637 [Persea americana]